MRSVKAKRWWFPWFVLAMGLICTTYVSWQLNHAAEARDTLQFGHIVDQVCGRIDERLDTYEAILHSTGGLFAANPDVDFESFRRFVEATRVHERYPGIQGIGFAQKVDPGEIDSTEQYMRDQGFADFHVWPEGPRDVYFPILYLVPQDRRNESAMGFDMFSEAVRQEAMLRAMETAAASASGRVTLVQEIDGAGATQAGFLVYVPIYETTEPPATAEERREQLLGFVYAPFRVGDLVAGTFPDGYFMPVRFRIYDGVRRETTDLIYDARPATDSSAPSDGDFLAARTIDVAGRPWTVLFRSSPEVGFASSTVYLPYVVFLGICISILLFGLAWAQVRARASAEHTAAELNAVLESMPDALFISSSRGITKCNRNGLALWGQQSLQSLRDSLGPFGERAEMRWVDSGATVEARDRPLLRALRGEVAIAELVATDPATREDRYLRSAAAPIRLGGRIAGAVCIISDITARMRAEEALRQQEAHFRDLADAMPQIVWIAKEDGEIEFFNDRWYEYTGAPAPCILEEEWMRYVHPDDRVRCTTNWHHALRTGEPYHVEYRIQSRAGDYRWHLGRALNIKDDDGLGERWYGTCTDIHNKKLSEEALQRLNDTLEQRVAERTAEAEHRSAQLQLLASELTQAEQRERNRIAQVLHDELQQLLFAVKMRLTRLRGNVSPEEFTECLDHSTELISEVIQAMRSLSVELSPPILHDRGLPSALEWLSRRMHDEHGLRVRLELDPSAEPGAEHVSMFLLQAARELLFNVVKHAEGAEATLGLQRDGGSDVRLYVADTGGGFDAETLRTLKAAPERFGLFNIQQRVELLGGEMRIESRIGDGACISVVVPQKADDTAASQADPAAHAETPVAAAAREQDKAALGKRIRVLLVDDHKIVRQGLAGLLEEETDIELVGEASDGLMALKMARDIDPDVIVMDVSMPRMNGVEATRRITAEKPGIRIIGLSMHQKEDMANAMREAGAKAYLAKDGPSEALVAAIRGD